MITSTQAAQYLDSVLGISVPAFLIALAIEKAESKEQALAQSGYTETDQTLIFLMTVALIAAAGDPRRLSSQGAPSGASRSFKYAGGDLAQLRAALSALDTKGIMADLVGPDPFAAVPPNAMFMVVG